MNKQEYLQALENNLSGTLERERSDILEYFTEYMAETDLEMEEIIAELGMPEELAEELANSPTKEADIPALLVEDFAILSLNGMDSEAGNFFLKAVYRSLAAAYVLDAFACKEKESLSAEEIIDYHRGCFPAELFLERGRAYCLTEWLTAIKKAKYAVILKIVKPVINGLKHKEKLDEVHSLLGNDLFFEDQAFELREFRVQKLAYQKALIRFKKDWLEDKLPSNQTIALYWLLEQNGLLTRLFSFEEQMVCSGQKIRLYHQNNFAGELWRSKLITSVIRLSKDAMFRKNSFFITAVGTGLAYCFPTLAKREAVFIGGENWISNPETAFADVVNGLRQKGHRCLILRKSKVPLVEIDNVLYEILPSARTFRYSSVFGLQLRRVVL